MTLREWVNLKLNFRFRANIYEPLDGELLHKNVAAGSFKTKNLVADFIRLKLNFI